MNVAPNADLCEHIATGSYPFQVQLVMDDHLGLTDGVVHCRACERVYLLEMLDWTAAERVFRISSLADAHATRLIRDLTRGSCDVQRAGAQVQHMKTAATFAPWLIRIDPKGPRILGVVPLPPGRRLPGASWRELPCDGSWVKLAGDHPGAGPGRSNTAIVKG